MEAKFWNDRWANNEIGFHESEPNALLVAHIDDLGLAKGSRLFLPLCGKTLDIAWLLSRGYRVAGAELSLKAIEELFDELGIEPSIERIGNLTKYSAHDLDIYVGDIFDLSGHELGPVDAVYDRAALVALPDPMRFKYSDHLLTITANANQLLITFEYDQSQMDGPPFSVDGDTVSRHYAKTHAIALLENKRLPFGPRGVANAMEKVWKLLGRVSVS